MQVLEVLTVVSPFRRTLRTQELGLLAANVSPTTWEAHDDLAETPFDETSCQRRTKRAIEADMRATAAHRAPLIDAIPDLAAVGDAYASEPRTQLEEMWHTGDKQLARVMKPRAKRFAVWLRARLSEVDCAEFASRVRRTRSWRFAACPTTAAHGIEHHRCIKLGASPADPGIGRAKERRGRGRTGRPRQKARVLAYCSECHARCVS